MDIVAIIKDNLPDGVEMSDRAISAIAKEIKREQGEEFVPKSAYSKLSGKVVDLETKISELEGAGADATAYKTKLADLEQKIKTMETDHAAALAVKETELTEYKATVESEKTERATTEALKRHLLASGANPDEDILKLLQGEFDRSQVKLEGDKISNWDELVKPVKESKAKWFGEVKVQGAQVATPPAGGVVEKNPWKRGESYSLEEQTRIYREDPAKARQLAAAAGVTLP